MDRTTHSQVYTDYNHNDTLFDSHYIRVSQDQDNWFTQQRAYSRSVLAGWGLPLGELPYTPDNQQTLRCLVQLISYRQKDIQFRGKVKQQITAITFQKDKYRSLMEQAQRSIDEYVKKLGRSENQVSELKTKGRRNEQSTKKQKDEDRKMITMLRTKNEQILHQIKKKQQEVNRVKEQMKKSVGERSLVQAKNSFQIFQGLSPKRELKKQEESKYTFLLERNERQMAHFSKENAILRDKLYEIRQTLLDFHQWVDAELFGQANADPNNRKTRFPLNHNLLFKNDTLSGEFKSLLQTAKDGILQLRDLFRNGQPMPRKKQRSSEVLPSREGLELADFKKKTGKRSPLNTDRSKPNLSDELLKQSKVKVMGMNKKSQVGFVDITTPKVKKGEPFKKQQPSKQAVTPKNFKTFGLVSKEKDRRSSASLCESELPFEDQLVSDLTENQDSSIISHIEVDKIGKNRFDKWDILYQDDE